uniref:GST C-terminal domain-containing protein n=1 Tax=Fagus sylvatica TaxID=28930 RepID=A0A2N9EEV9_FAGSY
MASWKMSYTCNNYNNTASSRLTCLRNTSVNFSLSSFCKKVTQIRFPNTTISPPKLQLQALGKARATVLVLSAKMAAGLHSEFSFCLYAELTVNEVLPPSLDSSSDPPPVFDGTTRDCRTRYNWFRIDLENRPAWYKLESTRRKSTQLTSSLCEVTLQVPSLEYNNEVKGESLDLIKYIDSHFEGPSLFPNDPEKKEFAEELLSYTDTFNKAVLSSFKGDGNEAGAAFDYIETALSKFEDGPFFLGQFSLVDIAYAPFIERFQPFLLDVKKYDILAGRPKLAAWIKEMDKIDAYKQTKREPKEFIEIYKKRFAAQL